MFLNHSLFANTTHAARHESGLVMVVDSLAASATEAPRWAAQIADAQGWQGVRRQSFFAGRALAAQALVYFGSSAEVRRDAEGAPRWPPGLVGSIAHSADHAFVAVASASQLLALGVDVEPDVPLPEDARSLVLRAEDHQALRAAFADGAMAHSRLVFSAKECVHKMLNPLNRAWLEFDEVSIRWFDTSADAGRWQALAVSAAAVEAFCGRELQGEWRRAKGALWSFSQLSS